jgi:hypothetical protein
MAFAEIHIAGEILSNFSFELIFKDTPPQRVTSSSTNMEEGS